MLAGWARLKYPHLFYAAVSSSSPLRAKLDFPQYNGTATVMVCLANRAHETQNWHSCLFVIHRSSGSECEQSFSRRINRVLGDPEERPRDGW